MATTINPEIQNMYDEQMKFNRNIMKYLRRIMGRLDDPDGTKAAERSKNNAFNRMMKADEVLCGFMGVGEGAEVSRSEGNKAVYAYIRDNNLKSPNDGRMFTPDDKLCETFGIPREEMMTLGVSKYISKHLVAIVAPTDAADPVDAVDPADKNGDGKVTRSEAKAHQDGASSSTPTPGPPSQPKKTPTKTTKTPTIRAPKKKTPTVA